MIGECIDVETSAPEPITVRVEGYADEHPMFDLEIPGLVTCEDLHKLLYALVTTYYPGISVQDVASWGAGKVSKHEGEG